MKVFCDIGNTQTKIILLENKKPKFKIISTKNFYEFYSKYRNSYFYISCVVKEIENLISKTKKMVKFISYKDLSNYIKIKYDKKNLGSDRILSAFVGKNFFGKDFLIISFGTAIVLDYVDKCGCYVGGEIFPGFNPLAQTLFVSTSKLPFLKIKNFFYLDNLIGHSTHECIYKGILNFCVSGILNFLKEVRPKNVILTGGDKEIFLTNFYQKVKSIKMHKFDNIVLFGILLWCYYSEIIDKEELKNSFKLEIFGRDIDFNKII